MDRGHRGQVRKISGNANEFYWNCSGNVPEKIQKIAIETSSDLIRQLIGEEVNNSSISAIVDDLYKKNKGKYYGN